MEELVPFASPEYIVLLGAAIVCRGMDFLSTWLATPRLILEANPIARKLGWKWGIPANMGVCVAVAFMPVGAIVVCTTSLLVAARNFQGAWLMRVMGEYEYSRHQISWLVRTPGWLILASLAGQTFLVALVGAVLVFFSEPQAVPLGIGFGIIGYAAAVLVYSGMAFWRVRQGNGPLVM